uniref:Odorant-binding protein 14 n=1 Tax=Dastarcus helophoroides TaxID=1169899 RepID=A0A1I9HZQ7_9CUCU|nr:odorant-binding protein 14 [Dastarcus helophoroides]
MNKLLILVVLCLATRNTWALSDEMKEVIQTLHDTCVAETGVDESLITKTMADKKLPEDDKLKCYIKCLQTETGTMEDGVLDAEGVLAFTPDDIRPKVEATIRKCGSQPGGNDCEVAYNTHACWLADNPDNYMLF